MQGNASKLPDRVGIQAVRFRIRLVIRNRHHGALGSIVYLSAHNVQSQIREMRH